MKDRRIELRFGADQPAVISVLAPQPFTIAGQVVEASRTGLRLMVEAPLEAGIVIKVEWDSTALIGETRYCRKTAPGRYCVGLKITEVVGRGKLRTQPGAA
jgi:hypothetical protein